MHILKLVDWHYFIGLMLLPFFLMGAILAVVLFQDLTRYNPEYFSSAFQQRYSIPNALITDLEIALRNGDPRLMTEIQGTKSLPQQLEPNPNLRFMIMLESQGKYMDYLFMDTTNYQRYPQHLKNINGRYVRVPDGLYYLVDSRKWTSTFFPLAAFWWVCVFLFTAGLWFFRLMAAYRHKSFGEKQHDH